MARAVQRPVRLPVSEVFTLGQVSVRPLPGGGFRLSHRDDEERVDPPEVFQDAEAALALARLDDNGNYRSLKTAPNLRHGWQIDVGSIGELRRALDFFYPGRLAMVEAREEHRLTATPLRESLGRQTGMYRVAANISDAQVDELVGCFCRSDGGCLRTILWKRDASGTIPSTKLPSEKFDPDFDQTLAAFADIRTGCVNVPLLCQEACNLLIAECRKAVKRENPSEPSTD
jgi:sirohydrochlorin cobaltochelatase